MEQEIQRLERVEAASGSQVLQISSLRQEIQRLNNDVEVARHANALEMNALQMEVMRLKQSDAQKRPKLTPSRDVVADRAAELRAQSQANFATSRAVLDAHLKEVQRFSEYQVRDSQHETWKAGFVRKQRLHRLLLPVSTFKSWCASALLKTHMNAMVAKGFVSIRGGPW